jgi:hypothetical protein
MLQCATTLCAGSAGAAAARSGIRGRHTRLGRFDLHVVREGHGALDVRAVCVDRTTNGRDLRHVRGEEARHVHHRGAVGPISIHVEHGDDRSVVRVLHRLVDAEGCVGGDCERRRPQDDTIAVPLPAQCPFTEFVAGVLAEPTARTTSATAAPLRLWRRGVCISPDEQLVLPHLPRGDLEIEAITDTMDVEHAAARHGIASDDTIVGARPRGTESTTSSTGAALLRVGLRLKCAGARAASRCLCGTL